MWNSTNSEHSFYNKLSLNIIKILVVIIYTTVQSKLLE